MKKSLLALAALSAFVTAAQAQSTVTVSGRLDMGYAAKTTNAASAGDVDTKDIKASPFATSFLRFNGSEDLGGGLKANFLMETGTSGAATTLGDRGLWVELAGGFGSLRAGTQNTITRDVWTGFAQTGAINIVGDLNSSTAEDAGGTTGVGGFETAVKYTTPSFNGLTVSAAMTSATSTAAGEKTGTDGTSFGLGYQAGKFSALAGYSSGKAYTAAVAGVTGSYSVLTDSGTGTTDLTVAATCTNSTTVACIVRTAPVTAAAAYETKTDITAIGASYDFGFAKAALTYIDKDVARSNTTTTGAVDRQSTTLSVQAPIGKAVLFASYGVGEQETAGDGYKGDLKAMQVGVKYNLSKRTFGYLATGSVEHDLSASTKNDNKETAVGLVHLF